MTNHSPHFYILLFQAFSPSHSPSPSLSLHLNFQLPFSHVSSCPPRSIFVKDLWLKIACWNLKVLRHLISYLHTSHTHWIVIIVFLHHSEFILMDAHMGTGNQRTQKQISLEESSSVSHCVCMWKKWIDTVKGREGWRQRDRGFHCKHIKPIFKFNVKDAL